MSLLFTIAPPASPYNATDLSPERSIEPSFVKVPESFRYAATTLFFVLVNVNAVSSFISESLPNINTEPSVSIVFPA